MRGGGGGGDELARLGEGRRGKVEARDGGGAAPGQAQRVGANVALEVRAAQAGNVPEERNVEPDDSGEVVGVGDKVLDIVVGRCCVLRRRCRE